MELETTRSKRAKDNRTTCYNTTADISSQVLLSEIKICKYSPNVLFPF